MRKHFTEKSVEWVCVDCHLNIAGYSDEETGRETTTPYADDETVTDVTNGSPVEDCEYCREDGVTEDNYMDAPFCDMHSEHDHDSFSMHTCPGCGSELAGDRYAVTVERTQECTCEPHITRMSHFGTAVYCETEQNAYCNFECTCGADSDY